MSNTLRKFLLLLTQFAFTIKQTDSSRGLQELKLSESKDLGYIGMNDTIPKKTMFLVPPLPLVEETKEKDKKPNARDVMEFLLKQQAGSTVLVKNKSELSSS